MTPEAKKGFASYRCATIDLFNIQVLFIVGDRYACARLIDRDRDPSYKCPKFGDGFLVGLEHVDKDSETRDGYRAVTMHVEPGVIIYAPAPIGLDVLVHEISHAAGMVLHIVGSSCDELRAYVSQYLYRDLSMADSDLIIVPSCEGKNTQKKGKTR